MQPHPVPKSMSCLFTPKIMKINDNFDNLGHDFAIITILSLQIF